jgi:hypothetical protein
MGEAACIGAIFDNFLGNRRKSVPQAGVRVRIHFAGRFAVLFRKAHFAAPLMMCRWEKPGEIFYFNLYQPLLVVKNRTIDAVRQNRLFIFQN